MAAKTSSEKVFASSALRISKNSSAFKSGAIKMTIRIVQVLPATGTQMFQKWMIGAFAMLAGGSTVSVFARRRRCIA